MSYVCTFSSDFRMCISQSANLAHLIEERIISTGGQSLRSVSLEKVNARMKEEN